MVVPPALEAIGLSKSFGSVSALDDVSLVLERGTVHALLGENGAGKSTLVKCIMGYYQADTGRVSVGGVAARIASPRDAAALGIGMVYQHFTLVDAMTVAENLVLSRQKHPFVFDWAAETAAIAAFMEKMPFRLDPSKPVNMLAAGEKQKLEILKQLYLGSTIVILDEPTSVLTPSEADEVLGLLRGMVKEGRLTVLMISHKFREVMKFADEVTVLRRGKLAGRGRVADLDPDAMARMMVGDEPPRATGTRQARERGDVVLRIDSLTAHDDLGMPAVSDLRLEVRAGEIVGIAGVSGNGQEELVEVLAGQRQARGGQIHIAGSGYLATRAEMRVLMVRCLPDEPLRNACVATMSVAENIGFRRFDRAPFRWAGALVNAGALRKHARALIKDYGIRTPGPDVADLGPVGRQRAARRAGARAVGGRVAAGRVESLLRPRLRGGRGDPHPHHGGAQPRRRGAADQRRPRRDLRARRSHRRHERRPRRPRNAHRPAPTWASSAATWRATPDPRQRRRRWRRRDRAMTPATNSSSKMPGEPPTLQPHPPSLREVDAGVVGAHRGHDGGAVVEADLSLAVGAALVGDLGRGHLVQLAAGVLHAGGRGVTDLAAVLHLHADRGVAGITVVAAHHVRDRHVLRGDVGQRRVRHEQRIGRHLLGRDERRQPGQAPAPAEQRPVGIHRDQDVGVEVRRRRRHVEGRERGPVRLPIRGDAPVEHRLGHAARRHRRRDRDVLAQQLQHGAGRLETQTVPASRRTPAAPSRSSAGSARMKAP